MKTFAKRITGSNSVVSEETRERECKESHYPTRSHRTLRSYR